MDIKKKKVGLDKLAKFQTTAPYSVQTRSILDNLDSREQCVNDDSIICNTGKSFFLNYFKPKYKYFIFK
jgi:hypothetical protein